MLFLKLFSFFILIHSSFQEDNSQIFCSKSFCKVYTTLNACRKISDACKAQNATHNGVFLPSDAPCSCCKYCLENINIGKECEASSSQSGSSAICGDGLSCQPSGSKFSCQKIKTKCTMNQALWDEKRQKGKLGQMELRPECDKDGNYLSVKCIPGQTCFCLSEDGKRIFGDIPYETNAQMNMKCECSRHSDKANKYLKINENTYSIFRPRCLPDGSYDTLQCFNSSCVCVDKSNGLPDKTTRLQESLINKENLACFDDSNHVIGEFYRSCEKAYKVLLDEIDKYRDQGIIIKSVRFPNCQQDGKYAPVQENDEFKYCVQPNDGILKDPDGVEYKVSKVNSLSIKMDCKCARANWFIKSKEKAQCLKNGNYNPIQCRRGLCFCVDPDGVQNASKITEVNITEKDKLKTIC